MEISTEMERLKQRIVGLWDVELRRIAPGGQNVTGAGLLLAKETSLGHAVFAEYALSIPGMDPYEEGELWWVDNQDKKVHFFCVNSREESRYQSGQWKNENTLVLTWKEEQKGKQLSGTLTLTWTSADEIHILRTDTFQGEKGPVSVFTLKRQKEMAVA